VIPFEFCRELWCQKTSPGAIVGVICVILRFDTIPECDRQTDRQTHDDGIYRA